MTNQEDAWEELDAEFDHYLVDMKPYVLKRPQRMERQRCALWIKKLCEPSGAGTGISGRKNRNLYAKLLLHMLKRGELEGPFTSQPEDGTLRPLPTYMSIYFDEPTSARLPSAGTGGLPDWVLGELEVRGWGSEEALKTSLRKEPVDSSTPTRGLDMRPAEGRSPLVTVEGEEWWCSHNAGFPELNTSRKSAAVIYRNRPICTVIVPSIPPLSLLYRHCPFCTVIVPSVPSLSLLYRHCPFCTIIVPSVPSLSLLYRHRPFCTAIVPSVPPSSLLYRHRPFCTVIVPSVPPSSLLYRHRPFCTAIVPSVPPSSLLYRHRPFGAVIVPSVPSSSLRCRHRPFGAVIVPSVPSSSLRYRHRPFRAAIVPSVHHLHKELEEEKDGAQKKTSRLCHLLREKEEQLARMAETQATQAQQADAALQELKHQVELNTEKVYAEMKDQMGKVEMDLSRSKSLREKQNKEFIRQLEEVKQRYEQQIVELKLEHEQEKTYLFQQHSAEKEGIMKDHEQEIDRLDGQLQNTVSEHEKKMQAWRDRDAKTISELEAQVYKLKEELIQVNAQRKQQLLELGHLREEERARAAQEHQMALSKMRKETESTRIELQKKHSAQTQEALEKAAGRLSQIEKEYGEKLDKSAQVVCDLQASMTSLREEKSRQQLGMERRFQEAARNHDEEKRRIMKENEKTMKLLKGELENSCAQLRQSEKRRHEKDLEMQQQITHVREEYEAKIRGLLPAALRKELEETIGSLKLQVNLLQKRTQVLQEELTVYQRKGL
ncbi:centrosomal protein of 112 kDa [Rana temporaria]|uniref:centrosomal protein of 112 kDa n=1 Tax=Rana temporaria TaxID=8407 RepID=UPI001AACF87A|nr:centrosomal protein of 112 kDa [Rana temporaria]